MVDEVPIPSKLIEAIAGFPLQVVLQHCRREFSFSPFDIYAACPQCGTRFKMRGLSAHDDVASVFDAVFEWMLKPGAAELVNRRLSQIRADLDADARE